ncbi:MAG: BrnA antitoxin family protein [Pseudomonadota bacterium]
MGAPKTAEEETEALAREIGAARELGYMPAMRGQIIAARRGSEVFAMKSALQQVPPAWSLIEGDGPPRPKKKKVTLRLDEDVAAWFQAQGRGHQTRMNDVLRAFMLMRRSGLV